MSRTINPGDITPMTHATVILGNTSGWVKLSYKAAKGRRFVFLFLGEEAADGSETPNYNERLNALGWVYQPNEAEGN